MDPSAVFGLDPIGGEAMALCVATAALLAASLAGGFVLIWRADHRLRSGGRFRRGPRELGVLALWRLDRALCRQRRRSPGTAVTAARRPPQASILGRHH